MAPLNQDIIMYDDMTNKPIYGINIMIKMYNKLLNNN